MSNDPAPPPSGVAAVPGDSTRGQFDWSVTPPSRAIVETVADAVDSDVLELPPLQRAIDADALDSLFGDVAHHPSGSLHEVSFTYADCEIAVAAYGEVTVEPRRLE